MDQVYAETCQNAVDATGAAAVALTKLDPASGNVEVVAWAGVHPEAGWLAIESPACHHFPLAANGTLVFLIPAPLTDPQRHTCLAFVRQLELMRENARLDTAVKTARHAAHQLNNKLGSTLGYGMLLREAPGGPSAARYAQAVIQSAEDAAAIVRQMQDAV
jgi:signal transduction histidine kinase